MCAALVKAALHRCSCVLFPGGSVKTTGKSYIWRRKGEAFKPKNTVSATKQGSGSIILWDCFALTGTGTLHKVDVITRRRNSSTYSTS